MNREPWSFRFSTRTTELKASKIRDLFDMGRKQPGTVDLSIGHADFGVPEPVRDLTIAAINEGCGAYSASEGYADVVAATKSHLQADLHLSSAEDVMMTTGASGALTLAFIVLLGEGDEVLIPDPYFVIYPNLARIVGAVPVPYKIGRAHV